MDLDVNQAQASRAENGEELEGPPQAQEPHAAGAPSVAAPHYPVSQRPVSKSALTSPMRPAAAAAGTSDSSGRHSRRESKRQRLSCDNGHPPADCSMSTS